jgi:hypothetical protein
VPRAAHRAHRGGAKADVFYHTAARRPPLEQAGAGVRFDIFTLFPGMFRGPFEESILARAQAADLVEIALHNPRDRTTDRHHIVDDYPYGGGAGMVMKADVRCIGAGRSS